MENIILENYDSKTKKKKNCERNFANNLAYSLFYSTIVE